MELEVLLFGPQAALAGAREVRVALEGSEATPAAVLAALAEGAPALAASLGASRLAVNHEFAAADTVVRPGDEVALVGMVSGG